MRRLFILALGLIALSSCGKNPPPPEPRYTAAPGFRLIHQGGAQIWVMCDRGNLVYVTERAGFQVVAGGCRDGHP